MRKYICLLAHKKCEKVQEVERLFKSVNVNENIENLFAVTEAMSEVVKYALSRSDFNQNAREIPLHSKTNNIALYR